MMLVKGKKGVSGVVTVVILVALVLVAIGVIWGVVSNLLDEQSGSIDVESECMNLNLDIESAECDTTHCTTNVMRRSGGGDMAGYLMVYQADDGTTSNKEFEEDLDEFESDTQDNIEHDLSENITKVEAVPYVLTSQGDRHTCKNSATYTVR